MVYTQYKWGLRLTLVLSSLLWSHISILCFAQQESLIGGFEDSGRSLSSATSGWRVSFQNGLTRSKIQHGNSSDQDWKAILKITPTTRASTAAPIYIPVSPRLENFVGSPQSIGVPQKVVVSYPVTGNNVKRRVSIHKVGKGMTTRLTSLATTSTTTPVPPSTSANPFLTKTYVQIIRPKNENVISRTSRAKPRPSKRETVGYSSATSPVQPEEVGRGFMRRNGQLPGPQAFQGQGQQQFYQMPAQNDGYIDPYHPVFQHNLNQLPHNPLHSNYGPNHDYPQHQHQHPSKKHAPHTSLMPMDKTLVYVSMIVTWIFWIVAFTVYYNLWGPHGKIRGHGGPIPNIRISDDSHGKQDSSSAASGTTGQHQDQPVHTIHTRSLDTSIPAGWNVNWGQVLYLISLAQETYEKFDFKSLECQKKALCELTKEQAEFGDTGRKISNTFSYVTSASSRLLDSVEGLPMPAIIQKYLKEYREAINHGKDESVVCADIYSTCGFSLKETLAKYRKKAATAKF